jgi:hypothetical protein
LSAEIAAGDAPAEPHASVVRVLRLAAQNPLRPEDAN